MAMEIKGSRQQQDGAGAGVKVKFIETQFISSDAASFKAVVQRLTGKSQEARPPAPELPQRPRPCRPAFASGGGNAGQQQAGWVGEQREAAAGHLIAMAAPKQEPHAAPPHLEELHVQLRDFSDLLYATGGTRQDGGSCFLY
ncbi:uncharacterized protein LOC133930328 [Phragmites australis]|uniref:uncharacterized protein LOC133930328 n=1 Tax=Phragmites australis TaxID=29695 RepID=UPI002D76BDAD|nr:uncharacterized protein LOC133930328 [Phragmites australis]